MTEARRKQVVEVLRKVASLLHTRGDRPLEPSKAPTCTVDLRALKKLASWR